MKRMRRWLREFRFPRRSQLDVRREIDEELEFHRAHLERDIVAEGASPAEAPHLAARRLGNVTRVREASRDRWSIPSLRRR